MQNEQTPAAGPLTAESVKLLKKGDLLLGPSGVTYTFDKPYEAIDYHDRNGAYLTRQDGSEFVLKDGRGPRSRWFGNLSFLGRPDQSGWIAWHGGENPVPGVEVEFRIRVEQTVLPTPSETLRWHHWGHRDDIIAYRPHTPSPASSSSVVQGDASGSERERLAREVHKGRFPSDREATPFENESAEAKAYCYRITDRVLALRPQPSGETREALELKPNDIAAILEENADADAEGLHNASQLAEKIYRRMKDIRPAPAALTPPAEPVSRPAGEGEREAVARQIQALLAIKNPSHPVPGLARELLQRAAALLSPAAPDAVRFYIDCEFDGHNGPLLSMALVREDGHSIHIRADVEPMDLWVRKNVLPLMDQHDASESATVYHDRVGDVIRQFIGLCERPVIIADSPVDIGRFCRALSTGSDGQWASTDYPLMQFEVHNVDCYPTELEGAVQHNAWWDAMALRHRLSALQPGGER